MGPWTMGVVHKKGLREMNRKDVEDVRNVLIKMRDGTNDLAMIDFNHGDPDYLNSEGRVSAYTECIDRLNGLLNKEEPKTYRYRVTGSDIVLPPNPPMICDCCWREMRGWVEVYDECKRAKLLLCTDCQDNAIFSGDMQP